MATVKYFQTNDTNDKNNISLRNVIFSVVTAYFILIMSMLVLSAGIVYGPLKNETADKFINLIYYTTCIICGFMSSVNQKKRGWLNGLIASASYFVVIVLSVVAVSRAQFGISFLLRLFLTFIFGIVGGIAGVNKRKKRKK